MTHKIPIPNSKNNSLLIEKFSRNVFEIKRKFNQFKITIKGDYVEIEPKNKKARILIVTGKLRYTPLIQCIQNNLHKISKEITEKITKTLKSEKKYHKKTEYVSKDGWTTIRR